MTEQPRAANGRWGRIERSPAEIQIGLNDNDRDKLLGDIRTFCWQAGEIVSEHHDLETLSRPENWMAAYAAERVIVGAATALQRLDEHVPGFRELNPDLPWRPLIGMRDIVSHAYDRIDLRIVWATLEQDLPILDQQIERIQGQH